MAHHPNKGIIYCRVSSQEQVQGTSLDNQQRACLEYAKNHNIQVVEIFIEKGESATAADRTEFLKALAYCHTHKDIGAFIVWKIDRFARNTTDHFAVRAKLLQYGTTLHSVTEPISGDPQGKLMETLLAGFAEFENEVRKQRCTSGLQARLREGLWPWHPPIGYLHSKKRSDRRKLHPDAPDPERFTLIQKALKAYATGHYSMTELTQLMNRCGFRTRTGQPMRIQLVDRILTEKYYAGILVDPWSGDEYPGRHTSMITPEEYQRIQWIKAGFSNHTNRPRSIVNPDFPLRGFVRCTCGGKLTGGWTTGRTKKYAYYHCKNRRCPHFAHGIAKGDLEGTFIALLETVTPHDKALKVFERAVRQQWQHDHVARKHERQHYEAQVKSLEARKALLIQMRMNSEITKDEFVRMKDGLEMRLTALTISRNEAKTEELDIEAALTYTTQFIRNLARQWQDMRDVKHKQRLQTLVLPEGIAYDKTTGAFRTAVLSPIFELNQRCWADESQMVAWVGEVWNRLIANMKAFMALSKEVYAQE